MNWRQQKSGSRFVTIYDGEVCAQLILDEPPQAEYNVWIAQRCEYYMRLEPCEPVRDEIPVIPAPPGTSRIRYGGDQSQSIWRILSSDPGPGALLQLEQIARKAEAMQHVAADERT